MLVCPLCLSVPCPVAAARFERTVAVLVAPLFAAPKARAPRKVVLANIVGELGRPLWLWCAPGSAVEGRASVVAEVSVVRMEGELDEVFDHSRLTDWLGRPPLDGQVT